MLKRLKDIGISDSQIAWLAKNHVFQVGDLVQKTESQLRSLPGFTNDHSIFEINQHLTPLGLQLGMHVPSWPTIAKVFYVKIEELDLSIRSANCLKNDNIIYLGDLVRKTEAELLRTPIYGRKSLEEIKTVLAALDLHLGMDIDWRSPHA